MVKRYGLALASLALIVALPIAASAACVIPEANYSTYSTTVVSGQIKVTVAPQSSTEWPRITHIDAYSSAVGTTPSYSLRVERASSVLWQTVVPAGQRGYVAPTVPMLFDATAGAIEVFITVAATGNGSLAVSSYRGDPDEDCTTPEGSSEVTIAGFSDEGLSVAQAGVAGLGVVVFVGVAGFVSLMRFRRG